MFHPVGQGAFYTERFTCDNSANNVNFVYDCGVDGDQSSLNTEIKSCNSDEPIDIVCLSHYHADHISGLKSLFERCEVKYVLLPLLSDEAKFIALRNNALYYDNNPDSAELIANQGRKIREISEGTKSDGVKTALLRPEFSRNTSEPMPFALDTSDAALMEICNGTCLSGQRYYLSLSDQAGTSPHLPLWYFVPFNFGSEEKSKRYLRHLCAEFWDELSFCKNCSAKGMCVDGKSCTLLDECVLQYGKFPGVWKKHRRQIQNAFRSINSDQNINSMVVYSGIYSGKNPVTPAKNEWWQGEKSEDNPPQPIGETGCLYFGDYKATKRNWKKCNTFLRANKCEVGILQLPHHGSKWNFCPDILRDTKAAKVFVSYGNNNKHKHPHKEVQAACEACQVDMLKVTEEKEKKLTQTIEFNL